MDKQAIYDELDKAYFSEDCHEKDAIEDLPRLLDGVRVFVDVGSSLGQYAYYASQHMRDGKILAVEADPIRFERLRENCAEWSRATGNQVTALHAAGGNEEGTITFYVTNSNVSGGLFIHSTAKKNKQTPPDWQEVKVQCVTLDGLFPEKPPDLIKIDVEGSELRVLRGATRILRRGTTRFLIEIHSWPDPEGQQNPEEVMVFMKSFGYRMQNFHRLKLFSRAEKLEHDSAPVVTEQPSLPFPRLRGALKKVPGLRPAVIASRQLANKARRYGRTLRLPDANQLRLRSLRGIHRGRRAWVIGNGPSLTQLDLSLLAHEITIGCNGIWLLFDQLGWRPTYYTVEDTFVAEDDAKTINRLDGLAKIFPRDLREVLTPDNRTVYVNFQRGNYPGFPRFSDSFDQVAYWGGTVTYMNLQLAHYLGCNPIYLVGVDMDYKVPDYKDGNTIVSRESDVNHFHPDYFGPGKRWHDPQVDRMIRCLDHASRHLSASGVDVFNATRGGKLETFPRVRYEDVFDLSTSHAALVRSKQSTPRVRHFFRINSSRLVHLASSFLPTLIGPRDRS